MNFKNSRDYTTMVLDLGSGYTKAGLVLDQYECVIEPTMVARGKGDDNGNLSFGLNAHRRIELLDTSSPISEKRTVNWDDLEKYYDYLFNTKLKMKPKNFSILNSYNLDDTLAVKCKSIEMFFEQYEVPMYLAINNLVLSVYGYGIKNGIVLDAGEHVSTAACVYDGSIVPWSVVYSKVAGSDVTRKLQELITADDRTSKLL
jgi:centractin